MCSHNTSVIYHYAMASDAFKIALKIAITIDKNKKIAHSDVHMFVNSAGNIVVLGGQFESPSNIKKVYITTPDIQKLLPNLHTILSGSKTSTELHGKNLQAVLESLEEDTWYRVDDSEGNDVKFHSTNSSVAKYTNKCDLLVTRTLYGFHSDRIIKTVYRHTGVIKKDGVEWVPNDTTETRETSFEMLKTENVDYSEFYTEFQLRAKSNIACGKRVKSFRNFDAVPINQKITDDMARDVMFVRLGKKCGVWLQCKFDDSNLSALIFNNMVRVPVPANDVTKSPSAADYHDNSNSKLVVYACRSASGLEFNLVIKATRAIQKGELIVLEGMVDDVQAMFYDPKIRSNNIVWNMVLSHRIPSYDEIKNDIRGRK